MSQGGEQYPRAITQEEHRALTEQYADGRRGISVGSPEVPEQKPDDEVNHPRHYQSGPIEVIEVIHGWRLGFNLGNVVKYILRHEGKAGLVDLQKARWYLDDEIARQGGRSWNPNR
jgi:hypothetical protein